MASWIAGWSGSQGTFLIWKLIPQGMGTSLLRQERMAVQSLDGQRCVLLVSLSEHQEIAAYTDSGEQENSYC